MAEVNTKTITPFPLDIEGPEVLKMTSTYYVDTKPDSKPIICEWLVPKKIYARWQNVVDMIEGIGSDSFPLGLGETKIDSHDEGVLHVKPNKSPHPTKDVMDNILKWYSQNPYNAEGKPSRPYNKLDATDEEFYKFMKESIDPIEISSEEIAKFEKEGKLLASGTLPVDANGCNETTFCRMMNQADWLGCKELCLNGAKLGAGYLEGKSVEEMRVVFGVTNDFTPAEEEAIRKENEWVEPSA